MKAPVSANKTNSALRMSSDLLSRTAGDSHGDKNEGFGDGPGAVN